MMFSSADLCFDGVVSLKRHLRAFDLKCKNIVFLTYVLF